MMTGKGIRPIILLAVAIGLGAVVIIYLSWQREPVYRGQRLSYWLQAYSPGRYTPRISRAEADAALDAAGTNAIPTLLRMLAAKDSTWKRKLLALAQKQRLVKLRFDSSLHLNVAAIEGFARLGIEKQNTVPAAAWISIYDRNSSNLSQFFAMKAVGDLGPSARSAIPFLLRVAATTNASPGPRVEAINALGRMRAPPELVVPVLAQLVHDSNPFVRDAAIEYLGPFGADPKSAISALVELLSNPDANLRKLALQALEEIDPDRAQ